MTVGCSAFPGLLAGEDDDKLGVRLITFDCTSTAEGVSEKAGLGVVAELVVASLSTPLTLVPAPVGGRIFKLSSSYLHISLYRNPKMG